MLMFYGVMMSGEDWNDCREPDDVAARLAAAERKIAQLRGQIKYLSGIAYLDHLTGCLNIRGLRALYSYFAKTTEDINAYDLEFVQKYLGAKLTTAGTYTAQSRRQELENQCIVIINIDANCLKKVNDLHSHAAGNAYLKAIAENLKGFFRGTDIIEFQPDKMNSPVGRVGGDEFVVMLVGTREESLNSRLEELIQSLLIIKFSYYNNKGERVNLVGACSVGVAQTPLSSGEDYAAVDQRADLNMYAAKMSIKSRFIDASKSDREIIEGILKLCSFKVPKGKPLCLANRGVVYVNPQPL